MSTIFCSHQIRIWGFSWILIQLLGLPCLQAQGQLAYQQATSIASTSRGCIVTLCGTITNEQFAVDANNTSAASVVSPTALSAAALRVQFAAVAPVGYQAGVAISSETGLDVSALGNVRIRTYLRPGTTAQQDISATSLLTVASLNSTAVLLNFAVTAPFDQLEVRVSGAATASYSVQVHYAETFNPQPLPVTLTGFSAKASGGSIELAWQTASERNASHFVIERSGNGQSDFTDLGHIPSQGTGPNKYGFRDATADGMATTLYYRLRQVDLDGQQAFSPVVVVSRPVGREPGALLVYPNPAPAGAPLHFSGAGLEQPGHWLRLYNSRGELLYQAAVGPTAKAVAPPTLLTGLYLVVLVNQQGATIAQHRVVIQN